jgi:hypothetical protein
MRMPSAHSCAACLSVRASVCPFPGMMCLALLPAGASAAELPEVSEEEISADAVKRRWQKWVAVRDAPFPGHPWRYSKHQLEYHYTRNPAILRRVR